MCEAHIEDVRVVALAGSVVMTSLRAVETTPAAMVVYWVSVAVE